MIVKKSVFNPFIFLVIFSAVYLWSAYIFPYYINGDQNMYTRFYEESIGLGFFETWLLQQGMLGAAEPGFAFIINIVNQYLTKIEFMSLSNGFLAALLFVSVKDRKALWLIFMLFVFNYYMSVLFFSAERLKFAVILSLILLNMRESNLRNILLLTPALFHFQYMLMIPIIFVGLYQDQINSFLVKLSFRFSWSKAFSLLFIALGSILILSRFSEIIIFKVLDYAGKADIFDLIRVTLMSAYLVAFSRLRLIAILVSIYFIVLVAILGSERIIIMEVAYIFAIFRLTDIYRVAGFLLIGTYFMLKTFEFYSYVFECGHGFICK